MCIVGSLLFPGKEMLSRGEWSGVRARVRVREHGSCSVYLPPRLADTESVIYRAILLARRQAATTVRRSSLEFMSNSLSSR